VARVGNAEALLDLEQVHQLRGRHGLRGFAQLRCHQHGATISFQNFHLEIRVLHVVVTPGNDAVVGHENRVVLVREIGDEPTLPAVDLSKEIAAIKKLKDPPKDP